jgi:hypothetical protein
LFHLEKRVYPIHPVECCLECQNKHSHNPRTEARFRQDNIPVRRCNDHDADTVQKAPKYQQVQQYTQVLQESFLALGCSSGYKVKRKAL